MLANANVDSYESAVFKIMALYLHKISLAFHQAPIGSGCEMPEHNFFFFQLLDLLLDPYET